MTYGYIYKENKMKQLENIITLSMSRDAAIALVSAACRTLGEVLMKKDFEMAMKLANHGNSIVDKLSNNLTEEERDSIFKEVLKVVKFLDTEVK